MGKTVLKVLAAYFAAYVGLVLLAGVVSCACSFAAGGNWGLW